MRAALGRECVQQHVLPRPRETWHAVPVQLQIHTVQAMNSELREGESFAFRPTPAWLLATAFIHWGNFPMISSPCPATRPCACPRQNGDTFPRNCAALQCAGADWCSIRLSLDQTCWPRGPPPPANETNPEVASLVSLPWWKMLEDVYVDSLEDKAPHWSVLIFMVFFSRPTQVVNASERREAWFQDRYIAVDEAGIQTIPVNQIKSV